MKEIWGSLFLGGVLIAVWRYFDAVIETHPPDIGLLIPNGPGSGDVSYTTDPASFLVVLGLVPLLNFAGTDLWESFSAAGVVNPLFGLIVGSPIGSLGMFKGGLKKMFPTQTRLLDWTCLDIVGSRKRFRQYRSYVAGPHAIDPNRSFKSHTFEFTDGCWKPRASTGSPQRIQTLGESGPPELSLQGGSRDEAASSQQPVGSGAEQGEPTVSSTQSGGQQTAPIPEHQPARPPVRTHEPEQDAAAAAEDIDGYDNHPLWEHLHGDNDDLLHLGPCETVVTKDSVARFQQTLRCNSLVYLGFSILSTAMMLVPIAAILPHYSDYSTFQAWIPVAWALSALVYALLSTAIGFGVLRITSDHRGWFMGSGPEANGKRDGSQAESLHQVRVFRAYWQTGKDQYRSGSFFSDETPRVQHGLYSTWVQVFSIFQGVCGVMLAIASGITTVIITNAVIRIYGSTTLAAGLKALYTVPPLAGFALRFLFLCPCFHPKSLMPCLAGQRFISNELQEAFAGLQDCCDIPELKLGSIMRNDFFHALRMIWLDGSKAVFRTTQVGGYWHYLPAKMLVIRDESSGPCNHNQRRTASTPKLPAYRLTPIISARWETVRSSIAKAIPLSSPKWLRYWNPTKSVPASSNASLPSESAQPNIVKGVIIALPSTCLMDGDVLRGLLRLLGADAAQLRKLIPDGTYVLRFGNLGVVPSNPEKVWSDAKAILIPSQPWASERNAKGTIFVPDWARHKAPDEAGNQEGIPTRQVAGQDAHSERAEGDFCLTVALPTAELTVTGEPCGDCSKGYALHRYDGSRHVLYRPQVSFSKGFDCSRRLGEVTVRKIKGQIPIGKAKKEQICMKQTLKTSPDNKQKIVQNVPVPNDHWDTSHVQIYVFSENRHKTSIQLIGLQSQEKYHPFRGGFVQIVRPGES